MKDEEVSVSECPAGGVGWGQRRRWRWLRAAPVGVAERVRARAHNARGRVHARGAQTGRAHCASAGRAGESLR